MIRVAVAGATGRMGKTLIQAICESDGLTLTAGFEHADHPKLDAVVSTQRLELHWPAMDCSSQLCH